VTASPRTLQVVLTVEDYEHALAFYRDGLGLEVIESWEVDGGRGVILDAGRATLELLSVEETERVDRIEAGEPSSGPVRFALEVDDSVQAAEALVDAGGERVGGPVVTPWNHRNVRIRAPDGMQLTLFSVLDASG
jgi:catechol 2,3-dioxygenase-like lactoylglutathione lyase family enzyme